MEQYEACLRALEAHRQWTIRDGYRYLEKPIPDSERRGELDPRVHEVWRRAQETAPQDVSTEQQSRDPIASALAIRAFMGWDNQDVTDGEIATQSLTIPGRQGPIPIRIYTPMTTSDALLRPVIIFFHGGGFIGGTLGVVENPCKCLALHADAVVVNVDYRLAPEHPYPAGLNDCFDTVRWVSEHVAEIGAHPALLAVAGDSAGANLATACTLMDNDQGTGMIRCQALLYPSVNPAGVETADYQWSLQQYDIRMQHDEITANLKGLAAILEVIKQVYADPMQIESRYVSPLLTDLGKLPDTVIVTAEFDYLRLEAEAYARKLARSGTNVSLLQYNGVDHAFVDKLGLYPQAENCMKELAIAINDAFGRNVPR